MQRELRPSTQREDQLTMETKLEQIAVKAANQLPKSVVREIRTPRSVGTGGGRPPPVTRWMWKRSHGGTIEAPPDERGGNRYVLPNATAPHLDSTLHQAERPEQVEIVTSRPGPLQPEAERPPSPRSAVAAGGAT